VEGPGAFGAGLPNTCWLSTPWQYRAVPHPARLGPDSGREEDAVTEATHMTLRMLAERIERLTGQIDELNQRLTRLAELRAPQ
jgi:hypothetical protein